MATQRLVVRHTRYIEAFAVPESRLDGLPESVRQLPTQDVFVRAWEQLHRLQPVLQPVEGEGEPAGDQQAAIGLCRVERPQHRGQHRRMRWVHPVRPGRIRPLLAMLNWPLLVLVVALNTLASPHVWSGPQLSGATRLMV